MREFADFIHIRLYYRLFVRPRPAVKAAPEAEHNHKAAQAAKAAPAG
jgi:hypothetical protein